mgnify:CR=1 FL=1
MASPTSPSGWRLSDEPPEAHERVFEVAPEEDLLYSLSADGKRKFMHPVIRKGRFWKIRRVIAYGLYAAFFALPLIPVGGHPALQFDIANRRTHVFGGTFYPTDSLILVALGFGTIVTVFFVGSTFGRMWCGYACPQTVWLEFLFRPIEALLEGGPANQRRLNLAPWTGRKFAVKAGKWAIWTAAALLMSSTFVAYFTGWAPLLQGLATDPLAWKGALFVMAFVAGAILFDFGWFRDQMCTIACPYGRLQNVLADRDTILVAYDEKRGDPKVRLKDRLVGVLAGDCIACRHCVSACPTGTDIRRGLQPECIGTAQCIDACDEVMLGQGKPIGLIKYTSEREQKGGTRRIWRGPLIDQLVEMCVANDAPVHVETDAVGKLVHQQPLPILEVRLHAGAVDHEVAESRTQPNKHQHGQQHSPKELPCRVRGAGPRGDGNGSHRVAGRLPSSSGVGTRGLGRIRRPRHGRAFELVLRLRCCCHGCSHRGNGPLYCHASPVPA